MLPNFCPNYLGGGESKPAGGANLGGVVDRGEGRAAIHGGLAKLERWAEEPCGHQAELCQWAEGGDPSPLLITGGFGSNIGLRASFLHLLAQRSTPLLNLTQAGL